MRPVDIALTPADKSAAMPDPAPLPAPGHRRSTRLHLAAVLIVVAYGAVAILPKVWHEREHHDFPQFYMGGVMAHAGDWAELYPEPIQGAKLNPGWPAGSRSKPGYWAAAQRRGVGRTFRYIQLPPNAILYAPLALLTSQDAYRLWHVIMWGFVAAAAWQAGRVYAVLGGPGAWGPAAVTLLVGCSPLMTYTARVSNTGPLLAACVGATALGLLRPERRGWAGPTLGIVVGGYTKFAPGVVLPVAVAMRRWRTVAATVALGVAIAGATMAVTGVGVWREFATVLWPPLQMASGAEANQTLYGLVSRVTHQFPLTGVAAVAVAAVRDGAGLAALALLVRRRSFWLDPAHVAAACALMMAWLLAFAPAAWAFYHCMLTPLWGWLAWEFARGRAGVRTAVVAAIVLTLVPTPGDWWGRLPEPIATRQFFSAVLVLAIAARRLWPTAEVNRGGTERKQGSRGAAERRSGGALDSAALAD